MESYGAELKETPYPLVAALGARELQARVLPFVRSLNEEFVPKLRFLALPREHRFPAKKELREKHGPFPSQTQRDLEGYRVGGVLKARWLKKHHELLPAQVDDAGVAPVNVTEERLAGLRKRLETDSKAIVLLRSRDLTRGSSVLAKLEAAVRSHAVEYYKAQAKRVKRSKKALNKTSHQPLHARLSFKIAHYYEFRRDTTKVLQHYEAAYRAVLALPLNENERSDAVGYFQVKTVAEFVNFKLCYHLLFSSGSVKAAVEQLHRHMGVYSRAIGPADRAYEHWEWVSRQYHVFAQLLSEAVAARGALPSAGLDSDVYKEPYLYYSIAAKYATYRRKAAARLGLTASAAHGTSAAVANGGAAFPTERDFVVVPPVFVGGDPIVSEAGAGSGFGAAEPSLAALVKYRHAVERAVPHGKRAIHLLEHAIQHLSLYTADLKSPRARMKSRVLVQLGTERLAAGDYERARAELQKAKLAFSSEHWWPQTTQVLKQLLVCTFRQGDIAAFLDYSLQILSPVVEEFVPATERVRIQASFLHAWRTPASQDEDSSGGSGAPLGDGFALPLDRTRPMFSLRAQFDRVFACVREDATLALHVQSHFPSAITMTKIEVVFNDSRYNTTVHHRRECAQVQRDPSDGQLYASLEFMHKAEAVLALPLRVLDGRSMLRYQETRFFLGTGTDAREPDEQCMVLSLPIEKAAPSARENVKPYLVSGRVPAMGNGSASPSFARRKSMFSVAELGRSSSNFDLNGSAGDDAADDDGGVCVRGSTLAILQPRARATLAMVTQHSLLTGDFRVITFRLAAHEDTLESLSVRVVCDPPPSSASPCDAFFFTQPAVGGPLIPVPLDASLQPSERTLLANMAPHSSEEFRVIVRSQRAASVRLSASVAYSTKSGVQVSLDERFELGCRDPFGVGSGFVHDYPNGVGAANVSAKELYAVVGKAVNLHGNVICSAVESLRVVAMEFVAPESNLMERTAMSGFGGVSERSAGDDADSGAVMKDGDMRSFFLRLLPRVPAPFASVGRVKLQWRRLSSLITSAPDGSHKNSIVTTWLDIPSVSFIEAPLTLSIATPSFGVEGALVPMDIRIRNNENAECRLRVSAGRTNAVEDLLPYTEHVFRVGLLPIKTGYLRLPQLEIVSLTYNMPFTTSDERRELFVLPHEPTIARETMGSLCACFSRRRPDNAAQLYQEQFDRIKNVYPGTNYVCLLNSENGEMIAQSEVATVNAEEFTRTIITLKRAALQFGEGATLNQIESQVVHVKGDDRMFSCYGSEKTILAFYSEMPGVDLELFDCSEADKGIESVNMELYRIAHSSHSVRRSK
ncbi:hypothetical protein PybrP1_008431 [[Pythium] brassicae (nom. inval.)]|nr:hypothetical protein PybrP1_008431 [[Pythium] brassicae (nom. inval.)]